MRLPANLQNARFVSRLNRFAAVMDLEGENVLTHIPNSGRLRELLQPENVMWLSPAVGAEGRKTAYDLALVEVDGVLVSADARLPNRILEEAIEAHRIPAFYGYEHLRREVTFYDSRVDFLLSDDDKLCYVEAKSVTLVVSGVALFPDAPTERGRRHLFALVKAVQQGHRAAVVFVVQRPDATSFSPNESADPTFSCTLTKAVSQGVEVYAYGCNVSFGKVELGEELPVRLS